MEVLAFRKKNLKSKTTIKHLFPLTMDKVRKLRSVGQSARSTKLVAQHPK